MKIGDWVMSTKSNRAGWIMHEKDDKFFVVTEGGRSIWIPKENLIVVTKEIAKIAQS